MLHKSCNGTCNRRHNSLRNNLFTYTANPYNSEIKFRLLYIQQKNGRPSSELSQKLNSITDTSTHQFTRCNPILSKTFKIDI